MVTGDYNEPVLGVKGVSALNGIYCGKSECVLKTVARLLAGVIEREAEGMSRPVRAFIYGNDKVGAVLLTDIAYGL